MENLDLILPEIFTSLSIMLFLIIGVFKKKSSSLIYNLSTISLVILLAIVYNLNSFSEIVVKLYTLAKRIIKLIIVKL